MIKINLASRKQAPAVGSSDKTGKSLFGGGSGGGGGKMSAAGVRRLIMLGGTALAAHFFVNDYQETELANLDKKIAKVTVETQKLQADLAKTKGYEELKKSLEADEALIRGKIETIQKIVSNRPEPSKMLGAVSTGIPAEVWLSEMKSADGTISMKGLAAGILPISEFMRNLGESAYFADLALVNSQQDKDDLGVEIATFEISAGRR